MSRSIALDSVLLLLATVASAQNAASLHDQGFPSDQGVPVEDTSAPVVFRLYDVQTGGSPLWQETQPAVEIVGGHFDIMLGITTPFPPLLFSTPLGVGNTATGPDGIAIEATTDATSATAVLGRA